MKKIKKIAMLCCLITAIVVCESRIDTIFAASPVKISEGDYSAFVIDENMKTCEVYAYSFLGKEKNLEIPGSIKGYTVIRVGTKVYSNRALSGKTERVVLPQNVREIEEYAFNNMDELKEVVIPKGLQQIGKNVFWHCTKLESIQLYNNLTYIGDFAFSGCGIKQISIPDSVTTIRPGAFINTFNLEEVKLGYGLTSILKDTFYNSAIKSIYIPANIKVIGESAFGRCYNLETIVLEAGLEDIGIRAFEECKKLKEIDIPDSVRIIGDNAFAWCSNLEQINLSTNLLSIGAKAFYKCSNLKVIEIPASVTTVANDAFTDGPEFEYVINKSKCQLNVQGNWKILEEGGQLGPLSVNSIPANSIAVRDGANISLAKLKELGSLIVKVTDNGTPIEGAQVIANGQTYVSNEKGTCILDTPKESGSITVKKDGYTDRTIDNSDISGKKVVNVDMNYTGGKFKKILLSCEDIINFNKNEYNVINRAVTIQMGMFKSVKIKPYMQENYADIYYKLLQYKKGELVNTISALTRGEFDLMRSQMVECDYMVLQAFSQDGQMIDSIRIPVRIVKPKYSITSIKFADKLSFTISKGVPIFGGKTIEIAELGLPISIEVNEKNECTVKYKGKLYTSDILKIDIDLSMKGSPEKLTGSASVTVKTCVNGEVEMVAGGIPLVVGGSVEASATGKGNIIIQLKDEDVETLFQIVADVIMSLELRAGVGAAYKASVGVYGKVVSDMLFVFCGGDHSGLTKWTLTGDAGVYVEGFLCKKENFPLFKLMEPLVLYDADEKYPQGVVLGPMLLSELDNQKSEVIDVELPSTYGEWNGVVREDGSVIANENFSSSDIKIVETSNGIYMILSGYATDRAANDAMVVMYSKLDKTTNTWSAPVIVDDDGTADDTPYVYSSGDKIYTVWNNMKNTIAEGTTVEEAMAQMQLTGAVLDTSDDTVTLLDADGLTDAYKCAYGIVDVSGNVYYIWVENTENSLSGYTGENVLKCMDSEGVIKTLYTMQEMTASNLVGFVMDEIPYAAFLERNLSGVSSLHIINMATMEELAVTSENVNSLQLIKKDGKDILAWYSNGSIYTWNGTQVTNLLGNMTIGGMNHCVVNGNANEMAIVYESAVLDGKRNLYMIKSVGNVWSSPVQITNTAAYAEHAKGYYKNGKLNVLYNQTVVTGDFDISTKLCQMVCYDFTDAAVTAVEFENDKFAPGEVFNLTVDLKNVGLNNVQNVDVQLKNAKGDVLAEQKNVTSLKVGEQKNVDVVLNLPANIDDGRYNVAVLCADDVDLSNNVVSERFGKSQLVLDAESYVYADHYVLYGTVTNEGLKPSTGMLTLYNFDTDEVYAKMLFNDLDNNSFISFDSSEMLPADVNLLGMIGIRIDTMDENVTQEECHQLFDFADIFAEPTLPTDSDGIVVGEDGNDYYMQDGQIVDYDGLIEWNNNWYNVVGGMVQKDYTGLCFDDTVGWWYVENGIIDFTYNGLIQNEFGWWCVAGGQVAFGYTGLWYDETVGWWYVENGMINFAYNGLILYNDSWWCVAGGRVAFEYTGLWSDPIVGWWYVENGAINFRYSGFVPNEIGWWYVDSGRVAFEQTGICSDDIVGMWFVSGGMIDFSYNGDVIYDDTAYTVKNGQIVF